jgi:hypothetical protein
MRRPASTALGVAHNKSDTSAAHAKIGERSMLGAGAAMAGWIPAPTISEVGQEWRLGQHGNVRNSIEASQGGVAHLRGLSAAVVARGGAHRR